MENLNFKGKDFKELIYVIRGQQEMLDSDLADLYGYEVKKLNQQVKRNLEKFPDDFMFQLTMEETDEYSRSHFVTLNKQGKNIKYAPYVFTEYMLAIVLKGDIAIQQSIFIMRSFKEMRHYLVENQTLLNNTDLLGISNRLAKHEHEINDIKHTMATKFDVEEVLENFIDEKTLRK